MAKNAKHSYFCCQAPSGSRMLGWGLRVDIEELGMFFTLEQTWNDPNSILDLTPDSLGHSDIVAALL